MDDRTVTIPISDHEQAFIDAEIASGRFATDRAVVRAGLAALEEKRKTERLRDIATDSDAIFLRAKEALEATREVREGVAGISEMEARLKTSEASGASRRQIPEIIADVKAKLRGHGAL